MARLARVVTAGMPHHITQRGNRRQQTFFHDEDYAAYVEFMGEQQLRALRNHARTGRRPGDATFVQRLEKLVGRVLRPLLSREEEPVLLLLERVREFRVNPNRLRSSLTGGWHVPREIQEKL